MLSYPRETALQQALVLDKSGRLDLRDNNFTDIIGPVSYTHLTLPTILRV